MTTIVTKRLTLVGKSHTIGHLIKVASWLNDPEVVKYSEQRHYTHSSETQADYISHGRGREFREIHAGELFIGTINAHIDAHNSVANVGILIGEKKEWGKGYGTEAWQAFCDYLLTRGIRKIEAGCMAVNFGMVHIFRKTGMHLEGTREQHFLLDDELIDLVQWARFA